MNLITLFKGIERKNGKNKEGGWGGKPQQTEIKEWSKKCVMYFLHLGLAQTAAGVLPPFQLQSKDGTFWQLRYSKI